MEDIINYIFKMLYIDTENKEIFKAIEKAAIASEKESFIADITEAWHDCLSALNDSSTLAELSDAMLSFANMLEGSARILSEYSEKIYGREK